MFTEEEWSLLVHILISYLVSSSSISFLALESSSAGFTYDEDTHHFTCRECGLELKDVSPLNLHAVHLSYGHGVCRFLEKYYHQLTMAPRASTYLVSGERRDLSEHLTTTLNLAGENETRPEAGAGPSAGIHRRYHHYQCLRIEKCKNDVLRHSHTEESNRDHRFEKIRFSTYFSATSQTQINCKFLAAAGLSFSDLGEVVCSFCDFHTILIEDNSTEKEIISSHVKRSPGCPFINGSNCGNVPDIISGACWSVTLNRSAERQTDVLYDARGLGISYQLAKHPEMAVLSRRQATFLTYPHVSPQPDFHQLCDAGYFYRGEKGSVMCFCCGVNSTDWETAEDPWKRHARSARSCHFLVVQKGEEYVKVVLEEMGTYLIPRQEMRINNVTVRMLRPRWDSPAVQRALDLGLDREAVKTVVCNRIKRGDPDFTTAAQIAQAVNELKVPARELMEEPELTLPTVVRESSSSYAHQTGLELTENPTDMLHHEGSGTDENEIPSAAGEAAGGMQTAPPENTPSSEVTSGAMSEAEGPTQTLRLARELSSQLTCSICLSDVVGIIFLPCAHLVCCITCAAAMLNCPICRREIRATIRVFVGGASQSSTQHPITSDLTD